MKSLQVTVNSSTFAYLHFRNSSEWFISHFSLWEAKLFDVHCLWNLLLLTMKAFGNSLLLCFSFLLCKTKIQNDFLIFVFQSSKKNSKRFSYFCFQFFKKKLKKIFLFRFSILQKKKNKK